VNRGDTFLALSLGRSKRKHLGLLILFAVHKPYSQGLFFFLKLLTGILVPQAAFYILATPNYFYATAALD